MVRAFLDYAAKHAVEDVQSCPSTRIINTDATDTSQVIPVPRWVHRLAVSIPSSCSERSEQILEAHLREYYGGQAGIDEIGGLGWTRVRGRGLEGEWIEMRKDAMRRAAAKVHQANEELRTGVRDSSGADVQTDRVVLYVHGGAFVRRCVDADELICAVLLESRDPSLPDPTPREEARRSRLRCRISPRSAMYADRSQAHLTPQILFPAQFWTS